MSFKANMSVLSALANRRVLFPLLLIFTVVVLAALKVSGSSLAIYEVSAGAKDSESGVVMGKVRPIRSDEWLVRTPWLMSQIKNGLPSTTQSGVGQHDATVVGDVPTRSLDVVVRPHHLSSWFLGPERALAAEWWIWHALMAVGIYSLFSAIKIRDSIAVPISLIALCSPSTQWWVAPGTFMTVGYGCLASAAFVYSISCEKRTSGRWFALFSGWMFACFFCTLYLPWIITTSIALGFLTFGILIHRLIFSQNRRAQVYQSIESLTIVAFIGVFLIGIFFIRHVDAITAISETSYPGNRVSESGGTLNLATLFGAPFDYLASYPQTAGLNGTNQSENSSGVLFIVPIALIFLGSLVSRLLSIKSKMTFEFMGALIAAMVFFAWALLPVGDSIGRLLLLDRVPPERLPPALAFVSLIALGIFLEMQLKEIVKPSRVLTSMSLFLFTFSHLYFATRYKVEGQEISVPSNLIVLGLIFLALLLLFQNLIRIGFSILLVLGGLNFLSINPIQVGATSLLENPVSEMVAEVRSHKEDQSVWMLIGGDIYVRGAIEATGVPFLSGVSRYPDRDAWQVLDPDSQYEEAWNRYGHLNITWGVPGSPPIITSPQPDVIQIVIDPCDKRLNLLMVKFIVTQDNELETCGSLVNVTEWGQRRLRVYAL